VNRRIVHTLLFVLIASVPGQQNRAQTHDEQIYEEKIAHAYSADLIGRPIGAIVGAIGRSFVGTPYQARTLEQPGPERLVINLRALDCVTFVENTLALSRCINQNTLSFSDYATELRRIRYEDGILLNYLSRLHYFTAWIRNNEKKGVVRDVTREIGGIPFPKILHFMSSHRDSYRQLDDPSVFDRIKAVENELNRGKLYYIPRDRVQEIESRLREGDIIAITTSIDGLDVSHTGMIVLEQREARYLHAPLSEGRVMISPGSISSYLTSRRTNTGIIVARPVSPKP
jgi:hypothetical protein